MYCRLPNAVQPCPKRAPRFVRRQTFRRVRVSAIISSLPPFLDRQTTIFLFSTISSLEYVFAKRDFYSIKITFLLRSPNFQSFARHSSYTLLSSLLAVLSKPPTRYLDPPRWSQPPRQDGKRKEEKGNKKEKNNRRSETNCRDEGGRDGKKGDPGEGISRFVSL